MTKFSVHHVSLVVNSIDSSLKFYSVLGFVDKYRFCDAEGNVEIHHLKNTAFIIELFKYRDCENNFDRDIEDDHKIGIEHFSMQVENIESAYDELANQDIKILTPITKGRTGIEYFFICDPDGNRIEIVEDKRSFMKVLREDS